MKKVDTKKTVKKSVKTEKPGKVQLATKKLIEAVENYIDANEGCVEFVASFVGFDPKKIEAKAEDVIADDSDRMVIFGTREGIQISLDALKKELDKAEEDEFGYIII